METQTALAVPDEDNCMVVYSSTQCPENVHATISRCLGIPQHNVRVITRRLGGGFGGKIFKSMPVSILCINLFSKLGALSLSRNIFINTLVSVCVHNDFHG